MYCYVTLVTVSLVVSLVVLHLSAHPVDIIWQPVKLDSLNLEMPRLLTM